MDPLDLLVDLHVRNRRQGPGSDDETRRAIELTRLDTAAPVRVLDLGCGTGASSLVLARALDARITAVDAMPVFIDRLRERIDQERLADRISAQLGRMESLPFDDHEFDLVWAEGSIYNMGFEAGVRSWRRLLRPGGVLAVTEITWTTGRRPAEVEAHWAREYPAITSPSANLSTLERAGYQPLAAFFLPRRCWEAEYYEPLRAGFPAFLQRHAHSEAAKQIVASEEAEMRLFREYGEWYGYAFYIARRPAGS